MLKRLLASAVLAASMLFIQSPLAATITDVGHHTIQIEGPIVDGDARTFFDLYNDSIDDPYTHIIVTSSPGGSFLEAMNIGTEVHRLGLSTEVREHCYSACAYIWLSGTNRYWDSSAVVGIHAPGVDPEDPNLEGLKQEEIDKVILGGMTAATWYLGSVGVSLDAALVFTSVPLSDIIMLDPIMLMDFNIPVGVIFHPENTPEDLEE